MIKHTLIATALIVGLAAPAFAADNSNHDRGRGNVHQSQQSSQQTYQRPTHTQPQYVAPQRQYQQPQRQYQQPRYQSNNGNGYAYGQQAYHPSIAPPRARYEQRPAARRGYAWQPGYYQYDNNQQYNNTQPYNWVPGQYVQQPYANAQYQPMNWQLLNGLWSLLGGNWQ